MRNQFLLTHKGRWALLRDYAHLNFYLEIMPDNHLTSEGFAKRGIKPKMIIPLIREQARKIYIKNPDYGFMSAYLLDSFYQKEDVK